jgi:thioredoxin reductase
MKFWRDMPRGINLKSFAFATNLAVPARGTTFPEWCRARGLEDLEPCTMESFATYGLWIQARFVPHLDPSIVTLVAARGDGFEVTIETGARVRARRVVVATGLSYFASMPEPLRVLPDELASHTFFHTDYARFAGKEVAVLGAGASAIEAAALLHGAGARTTLLARGPSAIIHGRMRQDRPLVERLRSPNSVLGPGRKNWVIENFPLALRLVPEERRARIATSYLPPAAPWWIQDRFEGKVTVHVRTEVASAERTGDRVRLRLREAGGSERMIEVDHVVAGTGYAFDLDRLTILDPPLRARMRRVARAPALSVHFESSVPGAYFLGPVASLSFGPLFRFVCGARYAAPALARHLAGLRREIATAPRRWTARARAPRSSRSI